MLPPIPNVWQCVKCYAYLSQSQTRCGCGSWKDRKCKTVQRKNKRGQHDQKNTLVTKKSMHSDFWKESIRVVTTVDDNASLSPLTLVATLDDTNNLINLDSLDYSCPPPEECNTITRKVNDDQVMHLYLKDDKN